MSPFNEPTEQIRQMANKWKHEWQQSHHVQLNHHQEEYFHAWLDKQYNDLFKNYRVIDDAVIRLDLLDGQNGLASKEMEILATLSDVAIELRWKRVISER